MTPAELVAKCDRQIAECGPDTVVVLTLRGRKGKVGSKVGSKVRLAGRSGPLGDVYDDTGGRLVVGFNATALRAFLEAEAPREG